MTVKEVVEHASTTCAHVSRGIDLTRNQETRLSMTAEACPNLLGYGVFSTQLVSPGDGCSFVTISMYIYDAAHAAWGQQRQHAGFGITLHNIQPIVFERETGSVAIKSKLIRSVQLGKTDLLVHVKMAVDAQRSPHI